MQSEGGRSLVHQVLHSFRETHQAIKDKQQSLLSQSLSLLNKARRERVRMQALKKVRDAGDRENEDRYSLTGTLSRGRETPYSVDGEDIIIDEGTWMFGDLELGSRVTVTCVNRGLEIYARKVVRTE